MMRNGTDNRGGFTLPEMMVATAISVIVVFTALVGWEMSWRESSSAATTAKISKEAFGVLQRIEQEVNRGETLRVPDPAYANVPSIEIVVPTAAGAVRRAFRLVNGALIVDYRDEGPAPYTVFDHITALTFTVLDAPTNAQVQISCTCAFNNRAMTMQTVAARRN